MASKNHKIAQLGYCNADSFIGSTGVLSCKTPITVVLNSLLTIKHLIAMIGIALLASCSSEVPTSQLEERQQRIYLINSRTPFSGTSVEHYENGQLNARIAYHHGIIVDGPVERYHDNGQLQEKGTYEGGLKHGVFKNYFGNGDLWLSTQYQRGKKHGIFETYHENTLIFRLCYQNGEEVYMPTCNQ